MVRLWRYLTRAPALDDARFRGLLRNTSLVGAVLVLLSELAPLLSPAFPQDVLGSGVMLAGLLCVGLAAHLRAPRSVVAGIAYLLFGILGWYISRVLGLTGSVLSLHRDAIYAVLAAAHALLLFSALEFTVSTVVFMTSLIASAVWLRGAAVADYTLTLFYTGSFYALAMVGIVTRTRLQRSEKRARAELERLNDNLHTEVADQVGRIRRAEALGRFLPPQVAEQVLAGSRDLDLRHHRRQVTVLCASPFGFLESLSANGGRLVNTPFGCISVPHVGQ